MTIQQAKKAWQAAEKVKEDKGQQDWAVSITLPCRDCTETNGGVEVRRALTAFTSALDKKRIWKTIAEGQDLVCSRCHHRRFKESRTVNTILCDSCERIQPRFRFDPEELDKIRLDNDGEVLRRGCKGNKGSRPTDMVRAVFCSSCEKDLPDSHFVSMQVDALSVSEAITHEAVCAK